MLEDSHLNDREVFRFEISQGHMRVLKAIKKLENQCIMFQAEFRDVLMGTASASQRDVATLQQASTDVLNHVENLIFAWKQWVVSSFNEQLKASAYLNGMATVRDTKGLQEFIDGYL